MCAEPARDAVLLFVDDSMRERLARMVRRKGFEVFAVRTPLDAIQVLERRRISHAILSAAMWCAAELRTLFTEEYPQVEQVLVV